MSFTDQKPRIATPKECGLPWNGHKRNFRCYLCGHKFRPGDTWRWVFGTGTGHTPSPGNFLTCADCDGPDVISRYAAMAAEWKTLSRGKWWRFVDQARVEVEYEAMNRESRP